jgi:hypothetical protein
MQTSLVQFFQYLNEPGKEENQSDEVEVGPPAGKAVNCSVHEEHPPFLRGSLVHSEYTGACQEGPDQVTVGFGKRKRVFRETIFVHAHFLNNKSSSLKRLKSHETLYIVLILSILIKLSLASSKGNFSRNKIILCISLLVGASHIKEKYRYDFLKRMHTL